MRLEHSNCLYSHKAYTTTPTASMLEQQDQLANMVARDTWALGGGWTAVRRELDQRAPQDVPLPEDDEDDNHSLEEEQPEDHEELPEEEQSAEEEQFEEEEESAEIPEDDESTSETRQVSYDGYTAHQLDEYNEWLDKKAADQAATAKAQKLMQHGLRQMEFRLIMRERALGADIEPGFDEYESDEDTESEVDEHVEEEDPPSSFAFEGPTHPEPDNKVCSLCKEWEASEITNDDRKTSDDPWYVECRAFMLTPAYTIRISWHDMYEALNKAHIITKKAFWDAYSRHWPVHCLDNFGESWEQVRFGSTELEVSGLGDTKNPHYTCQLCDLTRQGVMVHCNSVCRLRNAVCHPSTAWKMDILLGLLHSAEAFADDLKDHQRRDEVRQIIDGVTQKARETYAQIEACVGTQDCPGPRTGSEVECQSRMADDAELTPVDTSLPYHIQKILHGAAQALAPLDFVPSRNSKYTAVIVKAAQLWHATGRRPGEDDDFKARVEASRLWVKDNTDEDTVRREEIYEDRGRPIDCDSSI